MSKLNKREEVWLYLNLLVTLLLLVLFGWKVAVVEFLAVGVLVNLLELFTSKSL